MLDTNALLLVARVRFPLEAEIGRLAGHAQIRVPVSVRGELDRLVARGVPFAPAARALAGRYPSAGPATERGDAGVLSAARRRKAWVVTADRSLQARLRSEGLTVLVPRDVQRLERVGPLPRRSPPRVVRARRDASDNR